MKTVTTKAIAKVAAVATGLAMATSMLSFAPMVHAAALSSAQVQSILSLLSSFGADASTIANVQASLTGGTPTTTTTTTTTTSSSCPFTMDLQMGSTGAQVTALQNALKSNGYMTANATGLFGSLTKAGVIAWQKAKGVTPASGYFGAISRAAYCGSSTGTGTGGGTVYTGNGTGLKVMLSPTSPNGTVLVQKQAIGDLADFTFANPTSMPITVTNLSFKRVGVSNDATLVNVYLYNAGTRITDSAGVSNSAFSYSAPSGIFTVPANSTYTVSVRSDIANNTSGQQIGVQLVSVTSSGALDSSVSFPVMGGYQTISAANLAGVDYGNNVTPSATSVSPQNDFPVWQDTVSVSTNPVKLSSIKFTNLGSIDSSYVTNLRLYIDGVQAGNAAATMNSDRTVTFDLTSNPVLLSTQSHTVKVLANLTGGASRTIQLSVQRTADAMFVDAQLGQPVTATVNGGNFSAVTTGLVTINSVSANSGVSVSLAANSPTQNVAVGQSSVKWASFTMLSSGENVKVSDLYVYASSTQSTGALAGVGGLKNGKIFVNGVQVGSTKDIGSLVANVTDFSLGSSLILPAGVNTTVDIYGDAKDTSSTNFPTNSTVIVALAAPGSTNAQGQSSLNPANVPSSAIMGNTITVTSSSLTATKYTGYGNQTLIPGQTGAKIGAFTLSTGSTEGVTVNTINFAFANASVSSTITNLRIVDDATGTVLGSVISTPSQSNSYAVNTDIPVSSSKTIDIYADILSGANPGSLQATISTQTSGTGDLTGISASAASTALQTISLGGGTLTATRGAGDPVSNNVVAGASSLMVGEFNFASANSSYTVQNLAILVPNSAATSVTNVTLKYKDPNGNAMSVTQPLAVNAATAYATATFTGLNMYVPVNDSANLDVYVGTPTIASGATSGAPINVLLDQGGASGANNTFQALNGAGAATKFVGTGAKLASNGTFYVRKSIPTFAMLSTNVSVPSTGSPIYKFTVSADPAGAVEWSKLLFNVSTSTSPAVTLTNVYLVDDASGNNLLDNNTTSASTTGTTVTIDLSKNATQAQYQQVAAGATKTYDLYGTVGGFGSAGSTLTISLAGDGSPVANGTATTTSGNVIWSDRSATSHTIATSDWTNGYLLKNFTSNATTYSK
jgi:hypothetical protein